MATRSSKNNILAGILFVSSLVLAIGVIIALSDISERLTPMNKYRVRFPLAVGAEGLKPGSLVKIGGQPVGRVTGWDFDRARKTDDPTGVLVDVKVRSDVRIYTDATVNLHLALLGSNSYINIPVLGGSAPEGAAPAEGGAAPATGAGAGGADGRVAAAGKPLKSGDTIEGQLSPPSFLAQAGYGPKQSTQVQDTIRRINEIVASVQDRWDPKVRGVLEDVQKISSDARDQWPSWRDRVAATLENVKTASDKFVPITDDVKAGVQDARAMITENRPKVDSTLDDLRDLAHKINTEGWNSVVAMLDKGKKGIDDFADIAERADGLIKEGVPQLKTTIANARLASEELKLALAEVRANPWKLLSKPTGRKDLENEALYDAARAYSLAVSDLRATASALEAVAAAGGPNGVNSGAADREQAAMLSADLDAAFRKYREAEKRFLEKLQ